MKKMLDELKKLDVEYEVPQDFRKKVMSQIKAEVANEAPKTNKIIHLKKYVIACASVAAMFIVVVNVGISSMKELSGDIVANSTVSLDATASMGTSKIPTPSMAQSTNELMGATVSNGIFDYFEKDDMIMDSATNRVESSESLKVKYSIKDIEKELKRIDISYEIIEDEIFIQKINLIKVKDTMNKKILDNLEFIENNDKIQINIK